MNCAFDKEKLSGYYDGELDAAEKAEVERHIASCSECLRELGELKSAAILVKELPRLRAPRSIAEGVSKEIQAAGRVHSFARFRRTVMWAASAAAALFIGLNVIYFSLRSEKPAPEVAAKAASPAAVLGRARPAEDAAPAEEKERGERQAAAPERPQERLRADEGRRNELAGEDRKKLDAAPVRKAEAEYKDREKAALSKSEEKKPTAESPAPAPKPESKPEPAKPTVAAPAAAPPPAPNVPATAAPRPLKEENKAPAEAPADKSAKRDGDAVAGLKQKPAEAASDSGPTHLTLASTQMAKARPQMEEALRKMGVTLSQPPQGAQVKGGAARATAREETVYTIELTDAQIARLRAELEKPGTSMLVAAQPEDPAMAPFRRGGIYEPKKDVASAGSGAPAKKFGDPKADAPKEKDGKEAEEFGGGKAPGASVEKTVELRRKVVLHFMEVPFIPDRQPASDALKK